MLKLSALLIQLTLRKNLILMSLNLMQVFVKERLLWWMRFILTALESFTSNSMSSPLQPPTHGSSSLSPRSWPLNLLIAVSVWNVSGKHKINTRYKNIIVMKWEEMVVLNKQSLKKWKMLHVGQCVKYLLIPASCKFDHLVMVSRSIINCAAIIYIPEKSSILLGFSSSSGQPEHCGTLKSCRISSNLQSQSSGSALKHLLWSRVRGLVNGTETRSQTA